MMSTASSTSSVMVDRLVSSGDTQPASTSSSRTKASQPFQYVWPGTSSSTSGAGVALPVCMSVSSSSVSSRVPNPPGSDTKPLDSFLSMSLRVEKYFILTSDCGTVQ